MKLEEACWDDPDVQRLASDQQVEIQARDSGGEEPGTKPSAADIAVVVVARDDDGTALGCGALRHLGDDIAEVKRMYVVPAARRREVARAVLAPSGMPPATVAGPRCAWSGPRQPEGVGLYLSSGYRSIAAFGAYVGLLDAEDSLFFEHVLAPR